MLKGLRILIAVSLLSVTAIAQLPHQEIRTETELAFAVYRANSDAQSREDLLRAHEQLVNSQLWAQLSSLAANAYRNRLPQQSLNTYEAAIDVATRLQDSTLLAKSYYNIGITFSGLNQFPKAIESYEKSREHFERTGLQHDLIYILADLGALYFIQEDYEKARTHSESAIALADTLKDTDALPGASSDNSGRARALHTLAEIDLRDGNQLQAIEKLQTSLSLYQQLNGKGWSYNSYIAGIYAALGKVYPEAGDYVRGLYYLNKALDIVRSQAKPNLMASLLNSIGYLYMEQEDYAQSKAQFDESLRIYRSANNLREEARVLLNLGVVEQRQRNNDAALQHLRNSLEAARVTQNVDVQIAAGEGIGVILTAQKKFTHALDILNESLSLARRTKNKTREVELTWRSAQTLYEMKDYAEAASRSEAAVPQAQSAHLPKLEHLATTTLGQVYAAQNRLDLAERTLEKAVSQLESLRSQVAGRETASQLYFENKLASYHALVELLARQGKPTEALLYAERAKARVLLDVVNDRKADFAKQLTPAEREQALRLNQRISEINERLKRRRSSNGDLADALHSKLDAARLEYQAFQDSVYVSHPELRMGSGRSSPLTVTAIADLVSGNTAYLEYVVTKDKVWLFVSSKGATNGGAEVRVYPIDIKPDELALKVNQFHDRLANRHPDFASLARELYATLIAPAKPQLTAIDTICVVPDGFLWNLPFQALMTGSDHYLIEDHPLFYAPSLSVLREMTKANPKRTISNASLIAFGNPVIGKDEQRNEELCPLPEAETEVTSVAKFFNSVSNKVFIGREASEKRFKALAPTFSTIHLATHGVLDNRQPLYSHLLLTKTEGNVEDDGLLEAREIMNMSLNADLAVLSACETANGRISPGEGVVGMSWAFFVAGTRSMLVSQWKVNSASTSRLMANFYRSLETNRNKAKVSKPEALREAALKARRNASYRHPFYWAGFVLIGDEIRD